MRWMPRRNAPAAHRRPTKCPGASRPMCRIICVSPVARDAAICRAPHSPAARALPGLPSELELAVRGRAITQVQIDEALVRNADRFGKRFEVVDRFFVQTDRDLLLLPGSVGVLAGGGEIVFLTHGGTYAEIVVTL